MSTAFDPASLDGAVHLWICRPDSIADAELLEEYEHLLDPEERVRWQRLRNPVHRHRFLVTRALIRSVLSLYVDRAPGEWRFVRNRWNKPEIASEQNPGGLRPNLAHTAGLICCAITRGADVGVDVENVERRSATMKVAERFFAPDEIAALRTLDRAQQKDRFFTYWTLKESYIKARGIGVAAGLSNFAFEIRDDKRVSIHFRDGFATDSSSWNFCVLACDSKYRIAVARRAGESSIAPSLRVIQITPLRAFQPIDLDPIVPFVSG